jgi:hypothetical protein
MGIFYASQIFVATRRFLGSLKLSTRRSIQGIEPDFRKITTLVSAVPACRGAIKKRQGCAIKRRKMTVVDDFSLS